MNATKIDARRWLQDHDGQQIMTLQIQTSGQVWEPGPRMLSMSDNERRFFLDQSEVRLTPQHQVMEVAQDHLRIEWFTESGRVITTYKEKPITVHDLDEGDFVQETLVTDTVIYKIIGKTPKTLKLIRARTTDRVIARENVDGNPYPVVYREAVAADTVIADHIVRLRKDGTYRICSGARPLRPAHKINDVPVARIDYRM